LKLPSYCKNSSPPSSSEFDSSSMKYVLAKSSIAETNVPTVDPLEPNI